MASSDKSKNRMVKSPETFRERAVKAAENTAQPTRASKLKQAVGLLVGPVGNTAGKVFSQKPFQLLRRPLGMIGKVVFPVYFRNSWHELRLVTWPSWRESRRLTYAVLIFAIIFGASIALIDLVLGKLFRAILLK